MLILSVVVVVLREAARAIRRAITCDDDGADVSDATDFGCGGGGGDDEVGDAVVFVRGVAVSGGEGRENE